MYAMYHNKIPVNFAKLLKILTEYIGTTASTVTFDLILRKLRHLIAVALNLTLIFEKSKILCKCQGHLIITSDFG